MRTARIKLPGKRVLFHCISQVVGGQKLLDDLSKETLVGMLWKLAGFCGLEVITYCVMSNHFHILVRVPEPPVLTDDQRLEGLYGANGAPTLLARQAVAERGQIDADIRQGLIERMGDVSVFMLHREKFGAKRKDGAQPIRALASIGLMALRDLRVRALG